MVDNRSGLPHAWFQKRGPHGDLFDVLAIQGTFDFAPQGQPMSLASEQTPLLWGDEYVGPADTDPLRAVIRREGAAVLHKPGTDVHVIGTACAPDHRPAPTWLAGVGVGPIRKMLRLHGSRQFERAFLGWRLTAAQPVADVALDYRLAFGGCFTVPSIDGRAAEAVYKPDNPAGIGWLPDPAALAPLSRPARRSVEAALASVKRLAAPQIEHPDRPVRDPLHSRAAEGLSPVARWCSPRARYAGTCDARWQAERYPALPDDFDMRFHHSAHPDLIGTDYVQGDETTGLLGLLPEGPLQMRLPGWRMLAVATCLSARTVVALPVLDTVTFDLDVRQVRLTWRTSFAHRDPVRDVVVDRASPLVAKAVSGVAVRAFA